MEYFYPKNKALPCLHTSTTMFIYYGGRKHGIKKDTFRQIDYPIDVAVLDFLGLLSKRKCTPYVHLQFGYMDYGFTKELALVLRKKTLTKIW